MTTGTGHAVCVVGWDDIIPNPISRPCRPAMARSWSETPGARDGAWAGISMFPITTATSASKTTGRSFPPSRSPITGPTTGWDELGWCGNFGSTGSQTGWMAEHLQGHGHGVHQGGRFLRGGEFQCLRDLHLYQYLGRQADERHEIHQDQGGNDRRSRLSHHPAGLSCADHPGQALLSRREAQNDGIQLPIPVEKRITGYSSLAKFANGQSYASYNGSSWKQLNVLFGNPVYCNVCLRAYTKY